MKAYRYYMLGFEPGSNVVDSLNVVGSKGWKTIQVLYTMSPGPIPNTTSTTISGILLMQEYDVTDVPESFSNAFNTELPS